ncbi:hypothetical protein DFH08DRAFT_819083 [Mycena albidolilacea]|uniref:Uncharacterized protein n=1 Tax=Mycena albidolilacea TaxID=1033008 RepID=A0AAD6ZFK7_9AGAR|nr:hypothetical protein DFH08DRAFT_819083 [Mycena albidolilacea]
MEFEVLCPGCALDVSIIRPTPLGFLHRPSHAQLYRARAQRHQDFKRSTRQYSPRDRCERVSDSPLSFQGPQCSHPVRDRSLARLVFPQQPRPQDSLDAAVRSNTAEDQINESNSSLISRIEDLEKELITPWRAINTLLVLGLGVYKAVGTYQGQTTGPPTVDWIGNLVWATIVYWVSLYEPLVDDDPDSEELLVWIFCRDLSGIFPTFPELFFVAAVITGSFKLLALFIRPEPQFSVFLCVFISLVVALVCGIAALILCLCLLPELGSLLAKWRRHIPPFFRILPFDSSNWMIFDIRWT